MKTVNVSESALESIKRMAEDQTEELAALRLALQSIQKIAVNQDTGTAWQVVQDLCDLALCE